VARREFFLCISSRESAHVQVKDAPASGKCRCSSGEPAQWLSIRNLRTPHVIQPFSTASKRRCLSHFFDQAGGQAVTARHCSSPTTYHIVVVPRQGRSALSRRSFDGTGTAATTRGKAIWRSTWVSLSMINGYVQHNVCP
jgi:hypothetical protein